MAESDVSENRSSVERITRQSQGAENSFAEDAPTAKRKLISLDDAFNTLLTVDNSTKVRGNIDIYLAVEQIVNHSMEFGLKPEQLKSLVAIIVKRDSRLSQVYRSKLVKCLIPSQTVPEEAVVSVVCSISQKIFTSPGPSNLDALLLRWILLVLDYLDSYKKLHRLYGMIFNFVQSEKLLPYACQLLFLLTRKDDVKFFRVEQLKDIMKKLGPEPTLIGLLTCYKVFQPSLVSTKLSCSHKTFFKARDNVWRSTITSIVNKSDHQGERSEEGVWESEKNQQRLLMQPAKRRKHTIPKVHNAAREHEEETDVDTRTIGCEDIPFEEVDSFVHFLQVIENVQCPSQMAASLNEPRLQLLLSCNLDQVAMKRLCMWIQHFFVFGFDRKSGEGQGQEEKNNALLKLLCQFSEKVESLPVIHGFLESFLPHWDGHSYTPVLFSLISCIQPCSYEELQSSILEPLFQLFFASDIYFKAMCVSALTQLIRKFVMHMYSLQSSRNVDTTASSSTLGDKNQTEDSVNFELTQDVPKNQGELLIYQDCIQHLMKHLDVVVVVAMRMEKDHILLQHISLDMLETISNVYKMYKVPILCLPIRVTYRLLLSDCPGTVARLCGVINLFRENLEALRNDGMAREGGPGGQRISSSVDNACLDATLSSTDPSVFNSLLTDMLKMLWSGTVFSARKTIFYKSMFHFPFPKSLERQVSNKCLTLYRGPAFVGLSHKFLREIEQQGTKIKSSMIEDFSEIYLEFLDREHFPQFKEFVNFNLKSRQKKHRGITSQHHLSSNDDSVAQRHGVSLSTQKSWGASSADG